jgi:copper chaperone CopZ
MSNEALTLDVAGLDCDCCSSSLGERLRALDGVAHVELDKAHDRIRVAGEGLNLDALRQEIRDAGFKPGSITDSTSGSAPAAA